MAMRAILIGVVFGLIAPVGPAAAQPAAAIHDFRRTYDAAEGAKRRLAEAMMAVVADLEGAHGDEGNRLRATLDAMDASLGAWQDAVSELERLAASIGVPGARVVLARVYLDQHRSDDARRACERALADDPTRADAYALLGAIHLAQSRPARAVDAFTRAAAADAGDALHAYRLAAAYDALGRSAEAAAARQQFVAAAEAQLAGLWDPARPPLTDADRTRLREARGRFVTRSAPIDLVGRAGGRFAGFLPAAYERTARRFATGAYAEGLAALREGVEADPLAHDAALQGSSLGGASRALAEMDGGEAIRHLEIAVTRHPESSEARRLLGHAYRAAQDLDRAAEHYDAALALGPPDVTAERIRTARQTILLDRPGADASGATAAAAVAAHPGSGLAYQNLGRLHQQAGRNREAVAAYEQALARRPLVASDRLHLRVAEIHLQQLQSDDAIGAARAALALDPNHVTPRAFIARLLLEGSRLDEAYLEYLVTLVLDPLNPELHARVAQIELQRGRFTQAAAVAGRALAEDPAHAPARYTLGQALVRTGAVDDGRRELAEYARLQAARDDRAQRQRDLEALNRKALALAGAGELDRAIVLLGQAVELDPTGLAQVNLGLALMQAGRVETAVEQFEQAVALAPTDETAHLYLADAYLELGRSDDSARARAEYERLRAGGPGRRN